MYVCNSTWTQLSSAFRSSRLHRSGRLCRLALRRAGSRTSSGCNQTLISRCFIKAAGAAALGGSSLCLALGLPFHPMLMRLPLLIYELSSASPHRLPLQVYVRLSEPASAGRILSLQRGTEKKSKTFTKWPAEIADILLGRLTAGSVAAILYH